MGDRQKTISDRKAHRTQKRREHAILDRVWNSEHRQRCIDKRSSIQRGGPTIGERGFDSRRSAERFLDRNTGEVFPLLQALGRQD